MKIIEIVVEYPSIVGTVFGLAISFILIILKEKRTLKYFLLLVLILIFGLYLWLLHNIVS